MVQVSVRLSLEGNFTSVYTCAVANGYTNGSSPFARFLCAALPRYQLLRARKFRFTSLCVLSRQTINLYASCHGLWYRKGEMEKKKKKNTNLPNLKIFDYFRFNPSIALDGSNPGN